MSKNIQDKKKSKISPSQIPQLSRTNSVASNSDPGPSTINRIRAGEQIVNMNFGLADNTKFYNKWIATAGLERLLLLKNSGISLMTSDDVDNSLFLAKVYIICYYRIYERNNKIPPKREELYSLICGEILHANLPEEFYLKTADCLTRLKRSLLDNLNLKVPGCEKTLTDFNVAEHAAGRPVIDEDSTMAILDNAITYLATTEFNDRIEFLMGYNHIVLLHVAVVKRGTVTADFINKMETSYKDELNLDIKLDPLAIRRIHTNYAHYIDENNVEALFNHWLNMIPSAALRMKLTVQQAKGSGLTSYITIGRAMKYYQTFPWNRIYQLLPTDVANFEIAIDVIGKNLYYGYSNDISRVASTKYKSLAYVAKELLIKAGGEGKLAQYQGWTRTPKHKALLDEIIAKYINEQAEVLSSGSVSDEAAVKITAIHEKVKANADAFA